MLFTQKNLLPAVLVVVLSTLLPSCKKTVDTVDVAVRGYFDLPYPDVSTEGSFLVQSQVNNDPAQKNNAQIIGGFSKIANTQLLPGGRVTIGGYNLQPDSTGEYQAINLSNDSLFGQNLAFSMVTPFNAAPVTATFYAPATIFITNNMATPSIVKLGAASPLPVTWNADPANANGVDISATDISSTTNGTKTTTVVSNEIVPDNGSTVLAPSFFAQFPKGSVLWLSIGRGNTLVTQAAGMRYRLSAVTSAVEIVTISTE